MFFNTTQNHPSLSFLLSLMIGKCQSKNWLWNHFVLEEQIWDPELETKKAKASTVL